MLIASYVALLFVSHDPLAFRGYGSRGIWISGTLVAQDRLSGFLLQEA